MFGLVLVSDGQNEGPLNNGSDIYCSACSPLVWDNLGLFHMYMRCLWALYCIFRYNLQEQSSAILYKM